MVWFDHVAVTPGGNPEGVSIPVTPEVLCVMAVNGVLMHRVGLEEAAPTVLVVDTVMACCADTVEPVLTFTITLLPVPESDTATNFPLA
jgi:hypothetical protein